VNREKKVLDLKDIELNEIFKAFKKGLERIYSKIPFLNTHKRVKT